MAHIPVNHRLRTFYRVLATLAGLYVLVFGIVAVTRTSGTPVFEQHDLPSVLGLHANLGFAVLSVVAGIVIILAVFVGRNVDRFINTWGGVAFLVVGMLMIALLQTNANFLGFTIANCIVSFIIGIVLFTAGLYAKTGPIAVAPANEAPRGSH